MKDIMVDVSDKNGDYELRLDQEGMRMRVIGVFQTHKKETRMLNLKIIHSAPRTSSEVVLKGVAWDQSKLSLFGTVIVEKTAQQTKAFLHEQVLMLSDQTTVLAVPNLEIKANDVHCSHAAVISDIPHEQIFYFQSRGFTKKQAEETIVKGFLNI